MFGQRVGRRAFFGATWSVRLAARGAVAYVRRHRGSVVLYEAACAHAAHGREPDAIVHVDGLGGAGGGCLGVGVRPLAGVGLLMGGVGWCGDGVAVVWRREGVHH